MSDAHKAQEGQSFSGIDLFLPLPYRVTLIITSGIWAWGFNLYYLSAVRIDVANLIKYSSRTTPSSPHHHRIFRLAWTASVLQVVSLLIFWLITQGDEQTVIQWDILPLLNLLALVGLFVLPLQRLSKTGRYRFLSTLKRISIGGIAEAQDGKFGDILLADALTSYARILGDLAALLCMFLRPGSSATSLPDRSCGSELIVPLIVCVPSLIRLRQCIIEYQRVRLNPSRTSGWGGQHLANALKYATAFPVIILGAVQHEENKQALGVSEAALGKFWILSAAVNSIYSFYWDVAKDWDLSVFSADRDAPDHPWGLRRRRHFRSNGLYYGVILIDFVLRMTWLSRITQHLKFVNHIEGGIFVLQFLEVFRRWIWIFFRTEAEWERCHDTSEDGVLLSDFDRANGDTEGLL